MLKNALISDATTWWYVAIASQKCEKQLRSYKRDDWSGRRGHSDFLPRSTVRWVAAHNKPGNFSPLIINYDNSLTEMYAPENIK